ncbi:MAG: tripartite tricarboxylate transporter substrate binding protein [Variibacter sp.]|nr:tripartite tricarboxylate transporter substrate binding protein [Variibacter sp.]
MLPKLGLAAAIVLACTTPAPAQDYPSRSIRIVVSSGPAGSLDIIARTVGQKLSESLKQAVVIDNKPGASGIIGVQAAARSEPDGYTIAIGTTGTFPINFVTRKKPPYDPVRDFVPICLVAEADYLLSVHPSVPAATLQEFIALAKKSPGDVTYSSFGPGSLSHMMMEAFNLAAGTRMLHVPYKSGPDALKGLVAGEVQASFDAALVVVPQMRAGAIRVLATGGEKRSKMAPDVPTFAEAGLPGYTSRGWFGLFAPAGTPVAVIATLHAEIVKALGAPDLRQKLESAGLELVGGPPDALAAKIHADLDRYGKVARDAGIALD